MYDIYEDSVRCNWWELTDGKSIVFNEHENLIQSDKTGARLKTEVEESKKTIVITKGVQVYENIYVRLKMSCVD